MMNDQLKDFVDDVMVELQNDYLHLQYFRYLFNRNNKKKSIYLKLILVYHWNNVE